MCRGLGFLKGQVEVRMVDFLGKWSARRGGSEISAQRCASGRDRGW